MFPQELIIALPSISSLRVVTIRCKGVRALTLSVGQQPRPIAFTDVANQTDLPVTPMDAQEMTYQTEVAGVRFLKLTLSAGWTDFAAVFDIHIDGSPGGGDSGQL